MGTRIYSEGEIERVIGRVPERSRKLISICGIRYYFLPREYAYMMESEKKGNRAIEEWIRSER